ncbi:MAG: hypothetical protein R2882_05550 [Gemmatimonadales bacterium]
MRPGPALLSRANRRFRDRFEQVERLAAERDLDLASAGRRFQLDAIWDEVKRSGAVS